MGPNNSALILIVRVSKNINKFSFFQQGYRSIWQPGLVTKLTHCDKSSTIITIIIYWQHYPRTLPTHLCCWLKKLSMSLDEQLQCKSKISLWFIIYNLCYFDKIRDNNTCTTSTSKLRVNILCCIHHEIRDLYKQTWTGTCCRTRQCMSCSFQNCCQLTSAF